MKLRYCSFLILSLLAGCNKISIKREFTDIQQATSMIRSGANINLQLDPIPIEPWLYSLENKRVLSRDEAVSIALEHNPELHADFETLGVAKADLTQAGLFTNPNLDSVFRFPTTSQGPGTAQTNIEVNATILHISDFWQVPLNKRVAEDILEITSLRIITNILNTIFHTQLAYNQVARYQALLKNAQELLQETNELKEEISYRQNYGYTSDLDKYYADIAVHTIQLDILKYANRIETAYLTFNRILGLDPESNVFRINDMYSINQKLDPIVFLEEYALNNRPEMHIATMKIAQYEDTIAREKAHMWKNVGVGLAYKQDFDVPFRGWGPSFKLEVPLFDDNYAQVAKFEFLLKQAEKECEGVRLKIKEEIRKPYYDFYTIKKQVDVYLQNIIPTYKEAVQWVINYAHLMQINMTFAMQAKINEYIAKKQLIKSQYALLDSYISIERALGKRLPL